MDVEKDANEPSRADDAGTAYERLNEITGTAIGCAYDVANTLGAGFVEKVYENALLHELRKRGLKAIQQYPVTVRYDGSVVGEFAADIMVEDAVIVELKAVTKLDEAHLAQCLNYLKATGLRLCLLMNFGSPKIEIRRVVDSRQRGTRRDGT